MRVEVDDQACAAFGNCVLIAPDVFELDETRQVSTVVVPDPAGTLAATAEAAARECPMNAITITRDA